MAQRISIGVTDATVAELKTKLAEVRAILPAHLVALPLEEAKRLFKIGLQRRGLPDDGLVCAEANGDILPGTFKLDEQCKDVRSGRNLLALEGAVEQFLKETRGCCARRMVGIGRYGCTVMRWTHCRTSRASRCGWTRWDSISGNPPAWRHRRNLDSNWGFGGLS